jgi:putative transposase
VRRILAARYWPEPDSAGPSWLTVLGHAKDSRWSLDLFRCESAVLRTRWVPVVMGHYTRRIVGFGVHRGVVDGIARCRMFNRATRGHTPPTYVSSDHDPLYQFGQWQRNLRILEVQEIKTVPYVPLSHPFVERLIGTIRRECLDRTLFWTTADLEMKPSISNATPTVTARMPGWVDARQTRAPARAAYVRMSARIAGRCTVAGCITHR